MNKITKLTRFDISTLQKGMKKDTVPTKCNHLNTEENTEHTISYISRTSLQASSGLSYPISSGVRMPSSFRVGPTSFTMKGQISFTFGPHLSYRYITETNTVKQQIDSMKQSDAHESRHFKTKLND